jgi:hypothetical protein
MGKMSESFDPELIAPCGMNCGICMAYLREKNKCPGCRENCRKCIIKHCPTLKEKKLKFCSKKCEKFPCTRLKNLDKRYRTKYGMSMLENLEYIKNNGIKKFVEKEQERWKCPNCGGVICVHNKRCYTCEVS